MKRRSPMADDNKSHEGGRSPRGGDTKVPPRGWLLLIALIGFMPLLFMLKRQAETKYTPLSPSEFFSKLEATQIVSGTITFDPQSPLQEITGRYLDVEAPGDANKPREVAFLTRVPL